MTNWLDLFLLSIRHLFDIQKSKSAPKCRCFVHVHLYMCFASQRRAIFRHRNFQKWSEHGLFCTCQLQKWSEGAVFCSFWLGNVLRATGACNCSFLLWPHGSAPAALASLLVDPPELRIVGKNTFRDFPSIFLACTLFLLTFSRTWLHFLLPLLLCSAFHLTLLLCSAFSSLHIVGSLTFKLPSNIGTCITPLLHVGCRS